MFVPEIEHGFSAFQRATSSEVEKRLIVGPDVLVVEVGGGEADVLAGVTAPGKNVLGMAAFAEDVVDTGEMLEMPFRESFLVGDQEVGSGAAEPAGENALKEDIGCEAGFPGEIPAQRRDLPAV